MMKMKSGVEQAICILIMLATQIDQRPIKSAILSKRLSVSDSYLKKVMRSLVVSGLGRFRIRQGRRIQIEPDSRRNHDAAYL